MLFDDSLPEFVPGGSCSNMPVKFAPPGLPPMYTVLSDPIASKNRMAESVTGWKLSRVGQGSVSKWSRTEEDERMSDQSSIFHGEECLVPESIPDDLWQSHFRQIGRAHV